MFKVTAAEDVWGNEDVEAATLHADIMGSRQACNVCNKAFRSKSDLTKHMLVHSGVKPHECKTCGSRFTQKGSLVLHVKSVHQGLRQVCSECKKTFSDKSNLSKHVKTVHKKEKSHECSVCNKTFAHKSSLNHHKFICSSN